MGRNTICGRSRSHDHIRKGSMTTNANQALYHQPQRLPPVKCRPYSRHIPSLPFGPNTDQHDSPLSAVAHYTSLSPFRTCIKFFHGIISILAKHISLHFYQGMHQEPELLNTTGSTAHSRVSQFLNSKSCDPNSTRYR